MSVKGAQFVADGGHEIAFRLVGRIGLVARLNKLDGLRLQHLGLVMQGVGALGDHALQRGLDLLSFGFGLGLQHADAQGSFLEHPNGAGRMPISSPRPALAISACRSPAASRRMTEARATMGCAINREVLQAMAPASRIATVTAMIVASMPRSLWTKASERAWPAKRATNMRPRCVLHCEPGRARRSRRVLA